MLSRTEILNKFEIITHLRPGEELKELLRALTFEPHNSLKKNATKPHTRYLYNYLFNDPDGLKARLILIENDYSSNAYLGDYLNYYATCYRNYSRQCRRVHFFSASFTKEQFVSMILSEDENNKEIWSGYLGYIVIKPLASGFIGTTLINTYSEKEKRFFTAIRNYNVNLFGKDFNVHTLPYQEQDGIVGSCASSALWFAFQKTSELFKSSIPNPSDITISAGYDSYHTGKSFPSTGLEIRQICDAILSVGLVSELRILEETDITDCKYLKSFTYAYLKMGIPILLGIKIEEVGVHLVTLNGFRFSSDGQSGCETNKDELIFRSDEIIKFYAHDDQTGPFARLDFLHDAQSPYQFLTTWWRSADTDERLKAEAFCIIVPIKGSIKVTFDDIEEEIHSFEYALFTHLNPNFELKWDIFLSDSRAYKKEMRTVLISSDETLFDEDSKGILFESLPQYIWVAKAFLITQDGDFLLFDLVYDAVDVNYKSNPYSANIYNKEFRKALTEKGIINEFNVFKKYHTQGYKENTGHLTDLFAAISAVEPIPDTETGKGSPENINPPDTETGPSKQDKQIDKQIRDVSDAKRFFEELSDDGANPDNDPNGEKPKE